MLLEVDGLRVFYEGVEAIKSISLDVERGEVVSILGANGAGKSTLIRAISGLKPAAHGSIRFEGERIDALSPQQIFSRGIASVPEGRRLFPRMSVLENLYMGANLRRDRSGIRESLREVYRHFPVLESRSRQKGGTLSGGEQQMLSIGRALMARPKLLLLDEPSLGLAPVLIGTLFNVLEHIGRAGTAVLIAEQNARQMLQFASRAYVLEVGSVAASGKAGEIAGNEMVQRTYLGGA
jgi:branched-chain amino acid transport system ATP-binding protein